MELFTIRHGAYKDTFDGQGRKLVHTPDSALDVLGRLQTHQLCEILKIRGVTLMQSIQVPIGEPKKLQIL